MSKVTHCFGTDGIRGRVGASLINPEFVLKLGWAAGKVLARSNGGKVLVGKDTRISGYMLESALEAGLSAAGINIHLLGPMPTPAIAYLTRTFRAQAGIVISASHNLYADNGIKFFSSEGTKIPHELEEAIEAQLGQPMVTVESSKLGKAVRVNDATGRYIEFCKSTFPTSLSLSGLKIVLDCAQGATYNIAPHVFRELGAKVIAIGSHPDGLNINANCGSTCPDYVRQRVLSESADIGIAFDGDGDRVIMVDRLGQIVDGDELLFIIARDYQQRGELVGGVVGTIMTNFGFERAMQALNIEFVRAPVGDKHVMQTLKQSGWLLGGEASGHIVHLGLTTTGDAIISALQILRVMCQTTKALHELKAGMDKVPSTLINVGVANPAWVEKQDLVQAAVQKIKGKLGALGRVLVRASGTEPVVRVMVEGANESEVEMLAQELVDVIKRAEVAHA